MIQMLLSLSMSCQSFLSMAITCTHKEPTQQFPYQSQVGFHPFHLVYPPLTASQTRPSSIRCYTLLPLRCVPYVSHAAHCMWGLQAGRSIMNGEQQRAADLRSRVVDLGWLRPLLLPLVLLMAPARKSTTSSPEKCIEHLKGVGSTATSLIGDNSSQFRGELRLEKL